MYLVGAGPGDPGLLTVRGRELLERADAVVYDYLANPRLLDHSPKAQSIYVGKKSSQHTMSQEQINDLLIELGKAGKHVVRLKGGDPFVFGRGGEEALALAQAGIRFEVVPGVTAAVAAAAYAGIPVTHRDLNSSFTLITGHEKGESDPNDPAIDWPTVAKLPCVAFYMGIKSLPDICARLIQHGMPPTIPAATIQWGTHAKQRTVVSDLRDLPQRVAEAGIGAPAITIVGKVVSLRSSLNWFESRPLFGQAIAVTRTRLQASELAQKLTELGAQVIEAPTIELVKPTDYSDIDSALTDGKWDWIIFTSANGVSATRDRLREIGQDVRAFGNAKVAVVGEATAAAIRDELALRVDLCPEKFVAEALADALAQRGQIAGKGFCLLRADIARPILAERLARDGAALVQDVAIYQTKSVESLPPELLEALEAGRLKWITFTSASTARNFVKLLGDDAQMKLAGVQIASIGPVTTAALVELKVAPTVEARVSTIDGLVATIMEKSAGHSFI